MLPRTKRLTKAVFSEIITKGTNIHAKNIYLRFMKGNGRFSASVSKKVSKKAVDRNRIRRRIYAAIAPKVSIDGIFFAKNNLEISFEELKMEVASLLDKASLQ